MMTPEAPGIPCQPCPGPTWQQNPKSRQSHYTSRRHPNPPPCSWHKGAWLNTSLQSSIVLRSHRPPAIPVLSNLSRPFVVKPNIALHCLAFHPFWLDKGPVPRLKARGPGRPAQCHLTAAAHASEPAAPPPTRSGLLGRRLRH